MLRIIFGDVENRFVKSQEFAAAETYSGKERPETLVVEDFTGEQRTCFK